MQLFIELMLEYYLLNWTEINDTRFLNELVIHSLMLNGYWLERIGFKILI